MRQRRGAAREALTRPGPRTIEEDISQDTEPDELVEYFERYGWRFERRRGDLFRTGFVGESGHYEIWVRHADPWLYFTINPYVPKPGEAEDHPPAVFRLLLKSNHELNMAKFALDTDGDVSLSVELPTEGFGYSQFSDALTALSHYADEYRERFDAALVETEPSEVV